MSELWSSRPPLGIFSATAWAIDGVDGRPGGTGGGPESSFVIIGTGGPTGVYFVAGNAVCRMLAQVDGVGRDGGRQHGIRCAAPSSAGSTFNLGQIAEGEFQFAIVQSDWQFHSFNGTNPDRVVANDQLRAVFSLHSEPYQIVVGRDSDITRWADLGGRRFNIGNPGSGQRGTTEELLDAFGQTTDDFCHDDRTHILRTGERSV